MIYIDKFALGEDIKVGIAVDEGDVGDVAEITAAMRPVQRAGGSFVFVAGDAVAMTVTPRAAEGDIPAGWNLTIPAATTADLAPGFWGMDARLEIGGGVQITRQTAVIELAEAAVE